MANDTPIKDVMSEEPRVVHRNDTLTLADELMREEHFRHLAVLDEYEKVCGIVSERDIFRGALLRALGYGERAETKMLKTMLIKEVMSRDVVTVAPNDSVATAANLMIERKIGCLPVVADDRKLIGIVTESDLLRVLI